MQKRRCANLATSLSALGLGSLASQCPVTYTLDAFSFEHFAHYFGGGWIQLVTDIYVYVGIFVIYFKLNA